MSSYLFEIAAQTVAHKPELSACMAHTNLRRLEGDYISVLSLERAAQGEAPSGSSIKWGKRTCLQSVTTILDD